MRQLKITKSITNRGASHIIEHLKSKNFNLDEFIKKIARTELFRLDERNGNTLTFKSGKRYASTYTAKALQNTKTGGEICFVEYNGTRVMLDASQYFKGGRRISRESLNSTVEAEWNEEKQDFVKTKDCGNTFAEFINKKTEKR